MYGADMTTRAGDTVYGFNSTADKAVFDFTQNTHPVVTIWDAGGNDTLDLSGFNSNSVIDLNEGAFSSASNKVTDAVKARDMAALGITTEAQWQSFLAKYALNSDGSLHDNISIAYGAKIENAIGGVGNDTITGNALNNRLVGNAGNDTIKGGDGIDVISLGAGNDKFVEELGTKAATKVGNISWDVITDFGAGDKIDLTGLGVHTHFNGSSANKAVGDVTFKVYDSVTGAEHALGIDIHDQPGASGISGPVTVVFENIDGGTPDIGLVLLNHNGVSAGDFIFG
jgi:serralysin